MWSQKERDLTMGATCASMKNLDDRYVELNERDEQMCCSTNFHKYAKSNACSGRKREKQLSRFICYQLPRKRGRAQYHLL